MNVGWCARSSEYLIVTGDQASDPRHLPLPGCVITFTVLVHCGLACRHNGYVYNLLRWCSCDCHHIRCSTVNYGVYCPPSPCTVPITDTAGGGSFALLRMQLGTATHCKQTRCMKRPLCMTRAAVAALVRRRHRPPRDTPHRTVSIRHRDRRPSPCSLQLTACATIAGCLIVSIIDRHRSHVSRSA